MSKLSDAVDYLKRLQTFDAFVSAGEPSAGFEALGTVLAHIDATAPRECGDAAIMKAVAYIKTWATIQRASKLSDEASYGESVADLIQSLAAGRDEAQRALKTQSAALIRTDTKRIGAEARAEAAEKALAVPVVWSARESDGMVHAFDKASAKHGLRESLFAAAAWLLRHRSALVAPAPQSQEPTR